MSISTSGAFVSLSTRGQKGRAFEVEGGQHCLGRGRHGLQIILGKPISRHLPVADRRRVDGNLTRKAAAVARVGHEDDLRAPVLDQLDVVMELMVQDLLRASGAGLRVEPDQKEHFVGSVIRRPLDALILLGAVTRERDDDEIARSASGHQFIEFTDQPGPGRPRRRSVS